MGDFFKVFDFSKLEFFQIEIKLKIEHQPRGIAFALSPLLKDSEGTLKSYFNKVTSPVICFLNPSSQPISII